MKRIGHLFEEFVSYENLDLAERKARRGKGSRNEVRLFLADREANLYELKRKLENGEYVPSARMWKTIVDQKKRRIGVSPYYPDLIVQYALLNVIEPIWMKQMISTTYSCIKGRGIHSCAEAVKMALRTDPKGTMYALQIDISKAYDNVIHDVLEDKIRRKIKDGRILAVLFSIIESEKGLVIGDHISSWLFNLHLSGLDHKVKEELHVKYYFRYADDMLILAGTKEELWSILSFIERELLAIGMHVKHNASVFPVDSQGIDFIGYVFYHNHTMLRKRIKTHLMKKVRSIEKKNLSKEETRAELAGHWGWLKHCDSKNLQHKICKILGYEDLFRREAA